MKEEDITFSGFEAVTLNKETVLESIENLKNRSEEPFVASISHNCEKEKILKAFNAVEVKQDEIYMSALFGMPLVKKSYVPLNEVWLIGADGKPISKFKI